MNTIRPAVKICGLQPGDDLSFTRDPHVTHIGIVFVPASKRYVLPTAARAITSAAIDCTAVGVFQNASLRDILAARELAGIRVAQLHGDESVALCQELREAGLTVWKAVQCRASETAAQVWHRIEPYLPVTDAILLDAPPPSPNAVGGGHGKTFDWRVLQQLGPKLSGDSWWVAGGVTPENISCLLKLSQPSGVDVSSGVEVAGRKNLQRIKQLLEAVNAS